MRGRGCGPGGATASRRGAQGVPGQARTTAVKTSNGISYHGGPVFTTAANVYFIWPGTIAVTLRRCNTAA